jgi:hypothetical protein
MPDDAVAMNNQRRMMRWDAKKRKFVKVIYLFLNYQNDIF